jgi:tRNA dimethylallyltransferase
MGKPSDLISILGHTAGGKTGIAAHTAANIKGEIISADSRQVYKGMTIGTGKDYSDYNVDGRVVPVHLIDIAGAGDEYNVFEFQKDFGKAYAEIKDRNCLPILCGGTGLYLESVLRQYDLLHVPVNEELRYKLNAKDLSEIVDLLKSFKTVHNRTDSSTKKRAIRAVEIADYMQKTGSKRTDPPVLKSLTIGIYFEREERRSRITERLKQRLDEGMIAEAEDLIRNGVSHEKLEYYGLEYKFLSRYLSGIISYEEMFTQLNTAIHQFAKRQMTYFRGMEKRGISIHWINGEKGMDEKVRLIEELFQTT